MVTVNETMAPLGKDVPYRQSQSPDYQKSTFTADDVSDHIFKIDARGKGRMTLAVDNPANQALVATLYGMHTSTGAIGDSGVFLIDSFGVGAAGAVYDVANDPFPWYLVKITYDGIPTDDPLKTCSVWADFSAF